MLIQFLETGCSDIDNSDRVLLKVFDVQVREVDVQTKNQVLIYEYNDGFREKGDQARSLMIISI
tara:strand:+ start:943 stop:1134 length:192 start_codon:yes stop_codon:yes gene_type:complete